LALSCSVVVVIALSSEFCLIVPGKGGARPVDPGLLRAV
jgi:hypothetical protein